MRASLDDDFGWFFLFHITDDTRGFPTLIAAHRVVDHFGPVTERAETIALDDRVVCEYILTLGADDEAVAFPRIEPLHDP